MSSNCPTVGLGRDTSHTADLNSLCFFVKPLIHLVGSNDAIIHGAKPARHNDTDGTSVIKAFDLVRELHRDLETFKLGAKRSALHRLSVVVHRTWGRCFDVVNLVAHARNEGL